MASLAIALATPAIPGVAHAGTVAVFGDELAGFSKTTINNFYNSYGGHTSTILTGQLDANNLNGINLLWVTQPADSYTSAELAAMAGFLTDGGRIAFMGEHGTFAPAQNNRINAALSYLGVSMTINNQLVDPGFRSASVADFQIKSHPLTAGVSTYQYAAFAPIVVSGSAQVLMTGEVNPSNVMMAYQNVGAGSVFLITDQNVWDNAPNLWNDFDNEVMFDNLVSASTVPTGVPEPASWALLIGGFGLAGSALRRRRSTTVRFA
ncbi:PEPxxWA-CTERM sorting domain-containing protein [Sphingomonas sp.]|uniref:PEPxxWA-CTERM sorting domain-containing protein n=1 Tax=Sphingomonas sp. TaxID=28214 RepID=UPI002FD9D15F